MGLPSTATCETLDTGYDFFFFICCALHLPVDTLESEASVKQHSGAHIFGWWGCLGEDQPDLVTMGTQMG